MAHTKIENCRHTKHAIERLNENECVHGIDLQHTSNFGDGTAWAKHTNTISTLVLKITPLSWTLTCVVKAIIRNHLIFRSES